MSWEEEQRAKRDVLSGRRDYLAGPEYQNAHRSASTSAGEGAIVGGLIGSLIGLFVMIAAGAARLLGILLREWFLGIGRAWRRSALLGLFVLAAPPALVVALVVAQIHRTHAAHEARLDEAGQQALAVERSSGFQKIASRYDTPRAKRLGYMRARIDHLPDVSKRYVGYGFDRWWRDDQYKNDNAFLERLRDEECSTLFTKDTFPTAEECLADFVPPADPSVVALSRFDGFLERSENYRLGTIRYWQAYERGERAELPSLH